MTPAQQAIANTLNLAKATENLNRVTNQRIAGMRQIQREQERVLDLERKSRFGAIKNIGATAGATIGAMARSSER